VKQVEDSELPKPTPEELDLGETSSEAAK